jgi:hypothetical protein
VEEDALGDFPYGYCWLGAGIYKDVLTLYSNLYGSYLTRSFVTAATLLFCFNKKLILPFYLLINGIESSYCFHSSVMIMASSLAFSPSTVNLYLFAC